MKQLLHKTMTLLMFFALLMPFFLSEAKAQTIWNGSTVDISWYDAEQSTFNISTPEQLAGMAKLVNDNVTTFSGKTVNLVADIWLNADYDYTNNWIPIGGNPTATTESLDNAANRYFEGSFNGNFYFIYNMYCEKESYYHGGLFAAIRSTPTSTVKIQNLILQNPIVKVRGTVGHIAGFVGRGGDVYLEKCMIINGDLQGGTGNNFGSLIGTTADNGNNNEIGRAHV